jgi:hypothetical protein
MKHHEEELQRQIELGHAVEPSADAEAYRHVFKALRQEVNFSLPSSFADQLVARVQQEALRRDALRDRLWMAAGAVLLLAALVVSMVLVEFKPGVGVFTFFAGYRGLVIFGVTFILALHFIDRKMIRSGQGRNVV